jgi:hypothetical protein
MSRRLQDLFWDVDLTPTEQLVAQRLAWHADDSTGKCWPGIALICSKTGLSERAVQKAIQVLKVGGHITREEARGLGVVYFVHPRTVCAPSDGEKAQLAPDDNSPVATPADDAGALEAEGQNVVRPRTSRTPANGAPTPARRAPKQVKKPSDEKHGDAEAIDPEQLITGQRGRRITVDWQPVEPLPDAVANAVAKWPPGRLDEELSEFRDFWIADAGQRAAKRDWDRTWWNRLRAIIKHDKRREGTRHGQRNHDRASGWAARPGMEGAEPAYLND